MKPTEEFRKQADEAADREEEALSVEDLDEAAGGLGSPMRLGEEPFSGSGQPLPTHCRACGRKMPVARGRLNGAYCNACVVNAMSKPKHPD